MNTYKFKLKHDKGFFNLTIHAQTLESAKYVLLEAEKCPESAIVRVSESVTLYKVVKFFRVSGRRQILERGLTENQAQRVVSRYPNSNRSLVGYEKQFAS